MKNIKQIFALAFAIILVTFNSCKKDFLDVNTDPNNPSNVTAELLLAPVIAHSAFILGGQYQIIGGFWSQYWTQGPTGNQYNLYDQYQIPNTTFDRQWTELYSDVLPDCDELIKKGNSENKPNYAAIGYIFKAYIFQLLTDLHGDIPFSQALQGANNIAPSFDRQSDIYRDLIPLIDNGISLIDNSDAAIFPAADDLIFGGDMSLWEKFGNTLKLRIYLRQSEVPERKDSAMAAVSRMIIDGVPFLEEGEEGSMSFVNKVNYQHPLYTEFINLGNQNVIASNTAINFFLDNNDPRVDIFYNPAVTGSNAGQQAGIDQGSGKTPAFPSSASPNDFSQPGDAIAGPDAPCVFLSSSESYFLRAEAAVRGWSSEDAQTMYETGIAASFVRWDITDATALTDYLAQPAVAFPATGTSDDKIKAIITQKWAAMCGNQSVESWNEWRRTNYPDFFVHSATSLIGNVDFPERLPYPNSEIQTNQNTPVQPPLTQKVWWDVN